MCSPTNREGARTAEAPHMRNAFVTTFVIALLLVTQSRGLATPFDFFAGSWECTTDAGSKTFMLYHIGSNGLLEVSSSGDWKNDQLIFEGSANFPGGSYGSREIYTRWRGGQLEREHDHLTGFGWVKYSHSLCHRAKQVGRASS